MRVHFLSVATAFVALLFVLGTVGCKHTGGDWYKPSSYAWGTIAPKDSPTSQRSFGTLANEKPSLNDQPNLDAPYGGYSGGSRATATTGTSGGQTTDPWGQNQVATQTPPGHLLGGFTDPVPSTVPSNYPPEYLMGPNVYGNQQSIPNQQNIAALQQPYASQQGQYSPQYPQDTWNQQGQTPYGQSDHGATQQTSFYQPHNPSVYQPQSQQVPASPGGIDYYQGSQGNQVWSGQTPYGVTPQVDPFGGAQQTVTVPSSGFGGYDQQIPMQTQQPGFHNGDMIQVPVGTPYQSVPYQPYPPPPSSGFTTQGGISYY
ncbi:MAG: hypothetical protein FWE95_03555 [Planctomycetaceae bacterium]|nr:hypothetical protein [Planctomycetaceae bacterium]